MDFEAAWEGPVIQDGIAGYAGEVTSTIPVPIEDLVLCEHCVTTAGALIGLEPVDQDRVAELEEQLDRARANAIDLKKHVDEQDRALKSRDSFGNKPSVPQRRARAAA